MIGRDTNSISMEYPAEILISFDGEEDFVGRITVNQLSSTFSSEVDIINLESRKIFKHIGIIYKISDHDEAVKQGVQLLSEVVSPGQIT